MNSNKPSVAWGVFGGLFMFFIVLPLTLVLGVLALLFLYAIVGDMGVCVFAVASLLLIWLLLVYWKRKTARR